SGHTILTIVSLLTILAATMDRADAKRATSAAEPAASVGRTVGSDKGTLFIPFTARHGHIIVHGTIGKVRTLFIVDTGASETFAEAFTAKYGGLKPIAGTEKEFETLNSRVACPQAVAPQIVVGDLRLTDVPVRLGRRDYMYWGPPVCLGMDV